MLKTVFSLTGADQFKPDTLLLEIGRNHCSYACLNREEKYFSLIKSYLFNEADALPEMRRILDELQPGHFSLIAVSYSLPEAFLVPEEFSLQADDLLAAVFDRPGSRHVSDEQLETGAAMHYLVPGDLDRLLREKFSDSRYFHFFTTMLKVHNGFASTNQIGLDFTTDRFSVFVRREGRLELVQHYAYKTPLDVVYYLLKICYEFGLSQTDVALVLSGLIEKDSALYTELHHYFLNLQFAQPPSYSAPDKGFPDYYFTSLYNLATCVS